jgi:uncharacterized OB-fold protein
MTTTTPEVSPQARFAPRATPETQPYWDATAAGRLDLPKCRPCDQVFFYPRSSCPRCGSTDLEWVTCSGKGRLHTYVVSHRPAPGFPVPTVIAVVELDEGPRMMTNLVDADPEALELDMPVEVRFEQRTGTAVPVFAPVKENAG